MFAQAIPTATTPWEFYSLLAGMVFILVRQYLGDKAREAGIEVAKVAATTAATAATDAHLETKLLATKQDEQHAATNSRLSELIESIKKEQYALGLLAGAKSEQERVAAMKAAEQTPEKRLEEIRGQNP